ncbi:protein-L-isoaspartate(D-aspartate) O-methyltransferase [Hyphomicrobium sp. 99]|uniref:protein-L-isoaspartate(D-aspartate) O-methyltransferase n=1 Tax=Hyphomicrobium sp. 99 TaxID=1163419 RepID=UPI0005F7B8E5|nr:protein-L-isoaspartate(D-aspartate) O-methyltransferase [Hyphomicrobium sp. 99]
MRRSILTAFALATLATGAVAAEDFVTERRLMVQEIESMAAPLAGETGIAKFDPRVLRALTETPRHEFLPKELAGVAYKNRTLSIGHGQTISQPFIVALMSELLHVKDTDRVLEIGTGSGYQTAILSALAREVYTIEIIPELATTARNVLARLGYANVTAKTGDGYKGWREYAPFDAIIVTAAPDYVPPALIEQLKPGGRMVIPVGGLLQDLMLITKKPDGMTISTAIVPVRFVPFIRE